MDRSKSFYNVVVKRVLDIFFSLLLLIILFPFLLLLVIVNCFFTKFHPMFFQKRTGRNGKPFTIWKLRTYRLDAPNYKTSETIDSRKYYTKIGCVLRRWHLDELPQLVNVLFGAMSFIGPRPGLVTQTDLNEFRKQNGSIKLRPGITGYAQINGRRVALSVREKADFDKKYFQQLSFRLDLQLVVWTLFMSIWFFFIGERQVFYIVAILHQIVFICGFLTFFWHAPRNMPVLPSLFFFGRFVDTCSRFMYAKWFLWRENPSQDIERLTGCCEF